MVLLLFMCSVISEKVVVKSWCCTVALDYCEIGVLKCAVAKRCIRGFF